MGRIHVCVQGGCIQEILSTSIKDKVTIWDWDNINAEFDEMGFSVYGKSIEDLEEEYDQLSRTLHHIA